MINRKIFCKLGPGVLVSRSVWSRDSITSSVAAILWVKLSETPPSCEGQAVIWVGARESVRRRGRVEANNVAGMCGQDCVVQMTTGSSTVDAARRIVSDSLRHEPDAGLA